MKSKNPTNSTVYPPHLAEAIEQTWRHSLDGIAKLPPNAALLSFLEVLFQASFLREEGQLVRCRVIITEPGEWKPNEGPPSGFQILEFAEHRPFTAHEVRKLALAASYHRSLLAISRIEEDNYKIWGIAHAGPIGLGAGAIMVPHSLHIWWSTFADRVIYWLPVAMSVYPN
jgi:hypothetical protein